MSALGERRIFTEIKETNYFLYEYYLNVLARRLHKMRVRAKYVNPVLEPRCAAY